MTYAYKKSEHNDVAHSLFRNFEMDSSVNNELRKAVIRLAARARHGRNPDWLRRLRRMSRENLITQLRLVLRQTGYRAIVRLYNRPGGGRQKRPKMDISTYRHFYFCFRFVSASRIRFFLPAVSKPCAIFVI